MESNRGQPSCIKVALTWMIKLVLILNFKIEKDSFPAFCLYYVHRIKNRLRFFQLQKANLVTRQKVKVSVSQTK